MGSFCKFTIYRTSWNLIKASKHDLRPVINVDYLVLYIPKPADAKQSPSHWLQSKLKFSRVGHAKLMWESTITKCNQIRNGSDPNLS